MEGSGSARDLALSELAMMAFPLRRTFCGTRETGASGGGDSDGMAAVNEALWMLFPLFFIVNKWKNMKIVYSFLERDLVK